MLWLSRWVWMTGSMVLIRRNLVMVLQRSTDVKRKPWGTLRHQNAGSLKNLCFTNLGNCFSSCKTIKTIFNGHGSSELMKIKEIKCFYFLRAINARFSINNICEITLLNVLYETLFTLGLLNILTLPNNCISSICTQ